MRGKLRRQNSELVSAWVGAGIIVVLVALVYSNTLRAPFVLDDMYSIVNNPERRAIDISLPNWLGTRSVPYMTFDLNYRWGGLNVEGYHLVNIFIHMLVSVTGFLIAKALAEIVYKKRLIRIGEWKISNYVLAGMVVGLLFAVHPLLTQGVTYIVQRLASLATLFYLLAMLSYLYYRRGEARRKQLAWAVVSLVSAVVAMHCKEIAITLPFTIVIIEAMFFSRGWRKLAGRIPYLLPWMLTFLIIPAYLLGAKELFLPAPSMSSPYDSGTLLDRVNIKEMLGVSAETHKIGRWQYLITQFGVVAVYMKLLVWPAGQNIDHDFPLAHSFWQWRVLIPWLLILSVLVLGGWFWKKKRKVAAFGIVFFFIGLSVESSIIPISDTIFEHRVYLAFLGFALLAMDLWQWLYEESKDKKWLGRRADGWLTVMVMLALAVLAGTAYARNGVWIDAKTLWSDAVAKSPDKARPLNNLALAYMDEKELAEAEALLRHATEVEPKGVEAYVNLVSLYGQERKYEQAMDAAAKALALNPRAVTAYSNRSNVYLLLGQLDKAEDDLRTAVGLADKGYFWAALGDVRIKKGETSKAIEAYYEAVKRDADNAAWFNRLGALLAMQKRYEEAKVNLQRALELDPGLDAASRNLRKLQQEVGTI